ncbi:hypothetical protein [Mangrovicoccus algicola]|uniref:Uncharacterized protein n=1 Tax=Mangrovicoccus algicola TaxID=2771008 RepID=A0A8J6YY80_9RHOB|nr:hypothetical protein [Mangrovicoccus algicola]MBE3640112.1 hypothetical protein [Mangrovicoccus algicola]
MLTNFAGFYECYPSNILALKRIRREALAPELLEELDFHGKRQSEILHSAQVYVLDEPSQLMLQGLSAKMKEEGLDDMFSQVRLPFPAMQLTIPEPPEGMWPTGLITQHENALYTQILHENWDGLLPNLLIFRSQGAKIDRFYSPTFKLAQAIGDTTTEDMVIEQEQPLALLFLRMVVGMSILLQHKAMLETEEVPAFSRAERRRAQKSGRPLPDMRIIKVRLGELGKGQLQAMQPKDDGNQPETTRRRAHWVQGHFMRNRAGGISWRNPHLRGAGPVILQERHVSVAEDGPEGTDI